MITDSQIQAPPNLWKTVTGPDIGGPSPSAYAVVQGAPTSASLTTFRTSGDKYSSWLGYSSRWIPPSASAFQMDFDLWIDARVPKCAQTLEFDLKSKTFNFSTHINIQSGWVWEIDKGGKWEPVAKITSLTPFTKHHIAIAGKFDAQTFSPLTLALDGKVYTVPPALQNQPCTNTDWTPGLANIQIQQDANDPGGAFEAQFDNLSIAWS